MDELTSVSIVGFVAALVVLVFSWFFFLWRSRQFGAHKKRMKDELKLALFARDEAQDEVDRAIGLFQDKQHEFDVLQSQQRLTEQELRETRTTRAASEDKAMKLSAAAQVLQERNSALERS